MTWPPHCPRYKRPTPITVGDASGPHGCREYRDDPPSDPAPPKAAKPAPATTRKRS